MASPDPDFRGVAGLDAGRASRDLADVLAAGRQKRAAAEKRADGVLQNFMEQPYAYPAIGAGIGALGGGLAGLSGRKKRPFRGALQGALLGAGIGAVPMAMNAFRNTEELGPSTRARLTPELYNKAITAAEAGKADEFNNLQGQLDGNMLPPAAQEQLRRYNARFAVDNTLKIPGKALGWASQFMPGIHMQAPAGAEPGAGDYANALVGGHPLTVGGAAIGAARGMLSVPRDYLMDHWVRPAQAIPTLKSFKADPLFNGKDITQATTDAAGIQAKYDGTKAQIERIHKAIADRKAQLAGAPGVDPKIQQQIDLLERARGQRAALLAGYDKNLEGVNARLKALQDQNTFVQERLRTIGGEKPPYKPFFLDPRWSAARQLVAEGGENSLTGDALTRMRGYMNEARSPLEGVGAASKLPPRPGVVGTLGRGLRGGIAGGFAGVGTEFLLNKLLGR